MDKPSVLVLLGTRHRSDATRRCVDSVIANTADCDFWCYVADARDLGGPRFTYEHERVRVYEERPRKWMSGGLNRLVRMAELDLRDDMPDWVVWLNDDATVEPGWARIAAEALQNAPEGVGMVALPYLTPHPPEGFHVNCYPHPDLPYANFGMMSVPLWLETGCVSDLGAMDESVPFYGCDNAVQLRLLSQGLAILPVAGARVVHHFEEDATRTQNTRLDDDRPGWQAVAGKHWPSLPKYRELQRSIVPHPPAGFVQAGPDHLRVTENDDTYANRYDRAVDLAGTTAGVE